MHHADVYAACVRLVGGRQDTGHWSDLDRSHWLLYNLPTRNDKCLFCMDWRTAYALKANRTLVILYPEIYPPRRLRKRASERCRLSSLYTLST